VSHLIANLEQRIATEFELVAQLPHALRWSPNRAFILGAYKRKTQIRVLA
jgi:hypothetical protein